jgi:hypothetical protein
MSKEASNTAKEVQYGILMASGSALILGFILCIAIALCNNPKICESYWSGNSQHTAQINCSILGKSDA